MLSPSPHPDRQGLVTTDTSEPDPAAWYDARAAMLADSYEAIAPERLHGWLDGLLLDTRSLVLDVGAGSGRDAAWLAGLGHDVAAVEPSPARRAEAV
ncbi:MAG: class I SAM-dependent methyltransferase [Janthinobacterium lividum]